MADIAATHFNSVQDVDLDIPPDLREINTQTMLQNVTKLTNQESILLKKKTDNNKIKTTLKQSPNGKAPGINGIPTELYKKLDARWSSKDPQDNKKLNITEMLQLLTNDIKANGVTEPALLTGWICLIYKKKDKRLITNYHPVTILNAEYKIITTALMNKLQPIAPKLINKCQAAFIKN